MNYKGHLILSYALSKIFIVTMLLWKGWYKDWTFVGYIIVLIFISPLVADLDHKHGKLREWVTVTGLILALFHVYLGVILASFAYFICYTTNHRGYTHTIWFTSVYGLIVYLMTSSIELSVLGTFSYYTHLIGDKLWYRLY